jgi:carbon monoxide dehydrogenase subunit G
VELRHSFTVPVDRDTAWAAFQDVGSVAECFPGASVTSTEGDTFKGGVKVKLGPIALQYAGSGHFVERDATAYRMVIKAQGRDKRGNGTAGADVTATFVEAEPGATRVEVLTDLNITGKPAQFGRGVIQDVSDKLLGQFVECLRSKVAPPRTEEPSSSGVREGGAAGAAASPGTPASAGPAGEAASEARPLTVPDDIAVPHNVTLPEVPVSGAEATGVVDPPPEPPPAAQHAGGQQPSPPGDDDALDLGAPLLPVLLRSYGKQLAGVAAVLALLVWVVRRRS